MNNSIAKDATKLTIIKITTTVLTMLVAMLLSRFRTLEEYGTYSQIQLIGNLVTTLFMVGLPNGISFFASKAKEKKESIEFFSTYYTLSSLLSIIGGIVLLSITPFVAKYFNNNNIETYWYYMFLYPWTKIILAGVENMMVVMKNMQKLIIFKLSYSIITLGVVILAWLLGYSFKVYMLMFVLTEVIFSIWVYILANKGSGGIRVKINKALSIRILKFCIPIGLSSIISTLSIEIDKLLIGYMYTTEQLAVYTNASKELPIAILSTSITAVLMPQLVKLLSEKKVDQAIAIWKESVVLSYVIICFSACALIVFAPEVITLLYSSKYLSGVIVFRIYSLVIILRVTYFGILLNSTGNTKFVLYSSIIALILNVIFNFIGYALLGFIGPAMGTVLSMVIVAVIQLYYSAKVVNCTLRRIFPWTSLLKLTIVNIVLSIIAYIGNLYICNNFDINYIIRTIFVLLIWLGGYFLLTRKTILDKWKKLN